MYVPTPSVMCIYYYTRITFSRGTPAVGTHVLGTDGNIISVLYDPVLYYDTTPVHCRRGTKKKKRY